MTLHTGQANRGGARPGAGRPPNNENSAAMRQELIEALKKKAKETGRTLADELVDLVYSDDKRSKMPALRLIYNTLVISEQPSESGPRFLPADYGLPPLKPDPAKVVQITGDDDEAG